MLSGTGEAAEAGDNKEVHYIHMKNTKVYNSGNQPTPGKGKILWRGKLQEVDSFFLGKITEPKP